MTDVTRDDDAPEVVLYHIEPSLCSQKVRLVLAEKGVPYRSRVVDIGPRSENYEPWYARLNPGLVVPTLVVDDEPITDSAHIIREVDRRFEGAPLTPEDSSSREMMDSLIERADKLDLRAFSYGGLPSPMKRFFTGVKRRKLERLKRREPDLAEIYQAKLDDNTAWREGILDPEQVAAVEADIERALDELEARLETQDTDFLVCDAYTLADLIWTVVVARLEVFDRDPDAETRPRLHAWYMRMKARPSFDAADVWTRIRPKKIAPMALRWLAPRLAIGIGVVAVIIVGVVYFVT